MSSSHKYRKEIILLAEAFLEGTLDEAGAARLDRLVSGDPEAARLYVKYIELHAELHRMYEGQTPSVPSAPLLNDILGNNISDPLASSEDQDPPSGFGSSGSILGWFGVIAITLVMSVLVVMTLGWNPWDSSQKPMAQKPKVATLTGVSECVWPAGANSEVGSTLRLGERINLDEGVAEITYDTGAKVWIHGPATYVLSGPNRGWLEKGKLSANIPPEAIDFVVDTPVEKITDKGTEFEVQLRKDESSGETIADVEVIKGRVLAGQKSLVGGEALRMNSMQHRKAEDTTPKDDLFDPRTIDGMRLWLRADAAVMRDDQGRIKEMIDLIGGSNKAAENFRQLKQAARPLWVDRGLNGHSVLAFTGRQCLQLPDKSDLCFHNESLTIFVVAKASDHTQYFLSGAATKATKTTKSKKDVSTGFRFTTSRTCGLRYWAGKSGKVVRECPITSNNVLTVIHDRRVSGRNTVTLFCNGRQLGDTESVSDSKIENAYPLTIGANPEAMDIYPDSPQNYLHGDLAEVLIFDRVLTELEQQRIESYLQTRYGLGPVPLKME